QQRGDQGGGQRVAQVGQEVCAEHRGEPVQGGLEEQRGRVGGRLVLLLEGGEQQPQRRRDERQADGPGEHRQRGAPCAGSAAPRGAAGGRGGRGGPAGGGALGGVRRHLASWAFMKVRKISRSARVATTMVPATTTTPIAADWPMSNPRNVRW